MKITEYELTTSLEDVAMNLLTFLKDQGLRDAYKGEINRHLEKQRRIKKRTQEADESISDDLAQEVIEMLPEGLMPHILPIVKDWMLSYKDEAIDCLGDDKWTFCDSCENFVGFTTHTINGRVGHIDDWLPDDCIATCDNCNEELG